MKVESNKENFLNKFINFIFSNDSRKWLILIFFLGLILRFIAVSNNSPVADEMVHGSHALGVSNLAPLSTMTQGPIWFYLTDYSYRIFGVHLWSGRIMSLFFGSMSIIAVFLLTSLFFSRRTAIISAFLFAISSYQMLWARIYMDEALLFFVLISSYLFIKDYKTKGYITPLSGLFLGIGLLIKIISGVFIVVFAFFIVVCIYNNRTNRIVFKKSIKNAVYFFLIIGISLVPLIAHNYFLYKEKGIVDLPFAMYFGINTEVYQGAGLAHGEGFMLETLPKNIKSVFSEYFFKQDKLIFLIALVGLLFFVKDIKKEKVFEKSFILTLFGFAFLFIVSTIVLDTHYTYFTAFFAFLAAPVIQKAGEKIGGQNSKRVIMVILTIIFLFNIIYINGVLFHQSATEKMREFAVEKIGPNDLVVADSRIYSGNTIWMLNDKHYVDAALLPQVMEYSRQSGQEQPVHTYFIECAIDDCGWGTIKDQPQLNQSMEEMAGIFKNISQNTVYIKGGGKVKDVGYDTPRLNQYIIYETYIPLNPGMLAGVDQTHSFFFYEIPRDKNPEKAFDYYRVSGAGDSLLNIISYAILYLLIILTVLSAFYAFYAFYLVYKQE